VLGVVHVYTVPIISMSLPIEENVPLASKTTLGIGGNTSHYIELEDPMLLPAVYQYASEQDLPVVILGGGSNILVADQGLRALMVHPTFARITVIEDGDAVHVTAEAGCTLDALISYCVERELWGIENLSGIPGSVGAVPIQNVGAYGVEAKDIVTNVTVYDPYTNERKVLNAEACAFDYRDSIFKHREGKHLVVVDVTFKLSRTPLPRINYKDLLVRFPEVTPSLQEIRSAIIEIRSGKFPDWHILGTAGSFFKNPIISESHFNELKLKYPELPGFPHNGNVKIPLGWILDKVLNVRGYREGNVGLYEKQALVLINYGGATAEEILNFSDAIIKKIFDATSIRVEREVVTLK
jgi:UDP-N-acetylmuramate dehydrogenase